MSDKPQLQNVVNEQNSAIREAARAAIQGIHKDIVVDTPNSILPENVFKEYFLDFFRHPENYVNSPLLAKWIELANGPYNPVDIVDNNGNHLFTAPSALINVKVNYDALKAINFTNLAKTYLLKKKITNVQATNYLNSVLSTVPGEIHANVSEHLSRWIAVFERYDVSDNKTTTNVVQPPKEKPKVDLGIFDL